MHEMFQVKVVPRHSRKVWRRKKNKGIKVDIRYTIIKVK